MEGEDFEENNSEIDDDDDIGSELGLTEDDD